MATNNPTNTNTADTGICKDILPVIKSEIKKAESNLEAKGTLQNSQEHIRNYNLCGLKKAEEGNDLYEDILSFVTLGNLKKVQIIKSDIDTYIANDNKIGQLIKESSKNIKGLEEKLKVANGEASNVLRDVKNKLMRHNRVRPELQTILDKLQILKDRIASIDEKSGTAYKGAVTIAGLQTYTNTPSLKPLANDLESKITEFKANVNQNITSSAKDVETIRKTLNGVIEELSTTVYDKNSAKTEELALKSFKKFLCEEDTSAITEPEKFNCTFPTTPPPTPPAPQTNNTKSKAKTTKDTNSTK